jgi:parvulin-like peptidyl-prolyl isomerase
MTHETPPVRPWWDLRRVDIRRSLILSGAGALLGLALAGYALFTAKGTSTLIVPPEDVAVVNQQPIARSDYDLQLQARYSVTRARATPQQRLGVLNDMIREELFVQRGKELDVASVDPDVRTAMVSAVEQGIAADVISSQPSDKALQAYYAANAAAYSTEGVMTVRDLVFPDTRAATAAAQALRAGALPDQVKARLGGRDSGKVDGDEFYFAARVHLGPVLFEAAKALDSGDATAAIPTADGAHVLVMLRNIRPVARSFAEVRPQLVGDYRKAAIARVERSEEDFFRKRANVLIAKDMR